MESRTGSRLLQRTTRKLGLTDAGRIYFGYCERIVAEIDEAERALGSLQATPRGLLRVSCPMSFSMLGPVVVDFLKQYPDVKVELSSSDRRVDLVEEGFDLAVRAGRLDDSSLVVRPLGHIRYVIVAKAHYCSKKNVPRTPDDLPGFPCIAFSGSKAPALWSLLSGTEKREVRMSPRATLNDLDLIVELVDAGLGIALLPEFSVERHLRDGRLMQWLPEWQSESMPLQIVYPTTRHLSPKVAAFTKFLFDRLRARERWGQEISRALVLELPKKQ